MSFLKTLWADLVEKRLWPFVVLLLVALVGVPVALGTTAEPVPVSALSGPTGATGPVAGQTAQVALDPAVPVRRDRLGKVRDPFKQRAVRRAAPETSATATAPAAQTSTADTPSSGAGTAAPKPDPSPSPAPSSPPPAPAVPTPAPAPDPSYVVTVRFGEVGETRRRRDVGRLTPLPSADDPSFVHLGVLADRRTAVFLLSTDVKATGDGACKPRASSCETVELKRGDTEFIDVTGEDGKVTQYQLDVLAIKREFEDASARVVAKRKAADREAGTRDDEDAFGSDRYAFDDDTGLLRRVKQSAKARAEERAQARAAAADPKPTWLEILDMLGLGPDEPDAGSAAAPQP